MCLRWLFSLLTIIRKWALIQSITVSLAWANIIIRKLSEFLVGYINVGEDNNPQTRAFQVGKNNSDEYLVLFMTLILLESTATKRKETLDWLYFGEFESRYLDLQEKRLKGTGEWVLRSPIFQNWIKGKPGSLLLWGRAIGNQSKPS